MRLLGKVQSKAGSGAWGQGCELDTGSSSSLVPAEDSRDTCRNGHLSPPKERVSEQGLSLQRWGMSLSVHTHTHIHAGDHV